MNSENLDNFNMLLHYSIIIYFNYIWLPLELSVQKKTILTAAKDRDKPVRSPVVTLG